MQRPKPDVIYGLEAGAFSEKEQEVNARYGARLAVNNDHGFFVIEVKCCDQPIMAAENQCARAGAAMVRLLRKFIALAAGTYQTEKERSKKNIKKEDQLRKESEGQDAFTAPHEQERLSRLVPDKESYCYTLALTPSHANLFVNFAEDKIAVDDGSLLTTYWRMEHLTGYSLYSKEGWIHLHRDIDNILDWGTLKRKWQISDLIAKIIDRENGHKRQKTT